ncbi:hypothetical protein THAOC_09058, partial [Thalassiosira oceanica]
MFMNNFVVTKESTGGLAQLVERVLSMHEVVDSISTFSSFCLL